MNVKRYMSDFRITSRKEVERCDVKCNDCTFKSTCKYARIRKEVRDERS